MALALIGAWCLLSFAWGQPAPKDVPRVVAGNWEGKLVVGQTSLRIWLEVTRDVSSKLTVTLFSLDQSATPIRCTDVSLEDETLGFKVPAVSGSYTGTLDANGTSLDGTRT